jgi:sigma-E factor negative regulatory protein RseC
MIEEDARVLAVEPGFAWVEASRRSACGACGASAGCGTATVARLFGERANRIRVSDALGVAVGDRVRIGIDGGTLSRASLLAYLLPLAALALFAAAASAANAGDALSAMIAASGLGSGLWLAGRLAGRDRYAPVLLRRVASPDQVAVAAPKVASGEGVCKASPVPPS